MFYVICYMLYEVWDRRLEYRGIEIDHKIIILI